MKQDVLTKKLAKEMTSKLAVSIWNLGGENQPPVSFHKSLWVAFTLRFGPESPKL